MHNKLKNENLIKQTEILENMEKIEKSVEDDTKKIIKEEVKKIEQDIPEEKPEATCSEEIAQAFGVTSPPQKTSYSISDEDFDAILKKSNLFEVIKLMKETLPNDPIEIMDPTESFSNELIPCLLSSLSQKEKISFKFAQVNYSSIFLFSRLNSLMLIVWSGPTGNKYKVHHILLF